jgi:hypothetical protein
MDYYDYRYPAPLARASGNRRGHVVGGKANFPLNRGLKNSAYLNFSRRSQQI